MATKSNSIREIPPRSIPGHSIRETPPRSIPGHSIRETPPRSIPGHSFHEPPPQPLPGHSYLDFLVNKRLMQIPSAVETWLGAGKNFFKRKRIFGNLKFEIKIK